MFLALDFPDREEKENNLSVEKLILFVVWPKGARWCCLPQDIKHFTGKSRVAFLLSVLRVVMDPRPPSCPESRGSKCPMSILLRCPQEEAVFRDLLAGSHGHAVARCHFMA